MKLGILGTANIARKSLLPGAMQVEDVTVTAVAGRQKEKIEAFKEQFGIAKGYDSYEALLNDSEVEGVYIPLPNGLHYPWVIKALEAGKHVLCEKPLGISEVEVSEMYRCAKERNLVLLEAFAYRQSPVHAFVKEEIRAGVIGELKHMEANFTFMLKDSSNVRLSKPLVGGATYDIGCYNINLLRYLSGSEPVSIQSSGIIDDSSGVDTASTAILTFENGVDGVSHCSFGEAYRNEYRIYGTKGTIYVPDAFNACGKIEMIVETGESKVHHYIDVDDNYAMEVRHFCDVVSGKEHPIVTAADSLGNAKVIDRILSDIGY